MPSETDIGAPLDFFVSCLDGPNTSFTKYRGTVAFSSSDPDAGLPAPYTFTKADAGSHYFSEGSLIFNTPGLQVLTVYDVQNPQIRGNATVAVIDSRVILLSEHFDSWDSLDPHWTVWNSTNPVYNTIDVANGTLRMTNIDWPDVDNSYNSMANWTYPMTYDNLTVSFRIYLPYDDNYKEGYWGQFVAVILCDSNGTQRVIVRFLMDTWTGAPNGFTYVSQDDVWAKISDFSAGWHNCSISLQHGSSTWVATMDGVPYYGLTFATMPWSASDISKMILYNSLREEPITVLFDDVTVQRIGPPVPPPPPNTPPVAVLSVNPTIGNIQTRFAMDATGSYDKEDSLAALKARWDFESDGIWDTGWSSSMDAFHRYSLGGEYAITLEIKDTGNLTSTATANITVDAGIPFAYAGPDMVVGANTTINFWGNDSFDPETGIADYNWTFYGDGWEDHKSGVLVQETFTTPSMSPVTVLLTVSDFAGNYATDSALIWVWPRFTEVIKLQGHPGKSTVTYSIPGHENGDWVIQIENSGLRSLALEVYEFYNGTLPPVPIIKQTIKFNMIGQYPVGYVALDPIPMNAGSVYEVTAMPMGLQGAHALIVDAFVNNNLPPVAKFTSSVRGLTVNFDASETYDPDGYSADLLYVWSWGDGSSGYGLRAGHTYRALGTYFVTLKVIDNMGGYGLADQTIALGGTGGWQAPKLLQSISGYEQCGNLGMDDFGNAIVIWEQPWAANGSSELPGIWSIRYDHTYGWGTPMKIWDGPYGWGYTTLAVGPNGDAVAAWYMESPSNGSGLCVRVYRPSSGWGDLFTLPMSSNYGDVSASVDREGNVVLVVANQPTLTLVAWTYTLQSGWESHTIVSGSGAWPKVRFDGTGCALAMWNDFDTHQVKSCRYVPGAGWGSVTVASGSIGGYWVEFDVDDSGSALAVFFLYNGTAWQMYSNVYHPAIGWGTPENIGPVAGGWHPFGGYVAAGAPGEFFMMWQQSDAYDGGQQSVWTRKWNSSVGWGEPYMHFHGSTIGQLYLSVAANIRGEAMASWSQPSSPDTQSVVVARYDPVSGWDSPFEVDSSDTYNAYLGIVAMDPSGDAAVIWRQYDGMDDLLWGRIYLAGGTPPVNLPPVPVITVEWVDGLTVYVDGRGSYDPDGRIVWYSWTWWDGAPPTPPSPESYASHTYASAGTYTIRLQVVDDQSASSEVFMSVTVVENPPETPLKITTIYDMFQQPWGDWWPWRLKGYGTDIILSNVSGQYTMIYNPDMRARQAIIYAPYRMNVSAFDLTNLNVQHPEFMPVLENTTASGGSAEVNLYFNYLDYQWWNSYWVPRWSGNPNWPGTPIMDAQVMDGWYLGVVYQVTLNRQAAQTWLGMPLDADPMSWWIDNSASYRDAWCSWLYNEGNFRLDIWSAYEWPYVNLGTMMDITVNWDGTITLNIGHLSNGFEILMTRWLTESGVCSHEPYYEDFSLDAHYNDAGADWVAFDACCQYSLHAVRANGTLDGAAWVWEPYAIDYVPSWQTPGGTHMSRYDPYDNLTYTSWNAGDPLMGKEVLYENTPTWFNLEQNSRLVFQLPSGDNVIGYKGSLVPYDAVRRVRLYNDFTAYNNITTHDRMSLGYYAVTSNGTGGPDLWSMYDPVNNRLTIEGPIWFDNVRRPDGSLYHSAPWIEFNVGSVVVPDRPPVAEAGPNQYVWGQDMIYLDGSKSTDDKGIVSYIWTWTSGNGTHWEVWGRSIQMSAEYFFAYGNYTVTLTVVDTIGQTDTDTVNVDFGFRIDYNTPQGAEHFDAATNGLYKLKLENHNLTTLRVRILDLGPNGSGYIYDETINFGNLWNSTIVSHGVELIAGHSYQIEMTPQGSAGTYVIVYDYFIRY